VSSKLASCIYLKQSVFVNHNHSKLCDEHAFLNDQWNTIEEFPVVPFKGAKDNQVSRIALSALVSNLGPVAAELALLDNHTVNLASFSDDQFRTLTRFSREDFETIRNTANIDDELQLFVFLLILKTGMSQREAGALLGVSKSTVNRYFKTALSKITTSYTNEYFGIRKMSRNQARSCSTDAFQAAFPKVIAIWDGTYFYVEKSADFEVQKKSYSGQKNRNLLKEMVAVTPDGIFLDTFGLYYSDGKNNDQAIIEHIFDSDDFVKKYFQKSDEFLVDRGFSRAEIGHTLHFPKSIGKGKKQLSAEDANYTRKVTKFRYIIEAAFGRLKQFKFLANTISLKYAPILHDIIRAAMVLINIFMEALAEDSLLVETEVEAIIQEENNENELESMGKVTKGWKVAPPSDINVPQDLSIGAVREWALGPYALKLAFSYVSHSKFTLKWHFHPRHAGVLRVSGIPSRYVLILYDTDVVEVDLRLKQSTRFIFALEKILPRQ
jgi:predicted XRE-type DNA-binding protein